MYFLYVNIHEILISYFANYIKLSNHTKIKILTNKCMYIYLKSTHVHIIHTICKYIHPYKYIFSYISGNTEYK